MLTINKVFTILCLPVLGNMEYQILDRFKNRSVKYSFK